MALLIVDGNNLAHRARHSFVLSFRGKDVSVTYGTLRMLLAVVKEVKPEAVLMCFDGGYPGFRKRLIPTYKQHRHHDEDPTYPEFLAQLRELENILPRFGVLVARRKGIEADDLMYQATRMSLHPKNIVYTNDDDLLQVINDNTNVLKPAKQRNIMVTLDNFQKFAYGASPACYIAAKVLLGDSGDGVPGCFGVGEKTVRKLFANLDALPDDDSWNLSKRVTKSMANRVEQFWRTESFLCAWDAMDLAYDRSGARYTLMNCSWQPYDDKHIQRYCINNGFMSLIEASPLLGVFGHMSRPELSVVHGMRVPRVWDATRNPVE